VRQRTKEDCDRLVEMVQAEQRLRQSPQIAVGSQKVPKFRRSATRRTPRKGGVVSEDAIYIQNVKQNHTVKVKKSRKLPTTPRSRVRSALRTVWLRSRERAARLKLSGNSCERCGVKASKAAGREISVQVHHKEGIAHWEEIIDLIFAELLVDPSLLEAVCVACHKAEHGKGENEKSDVQTRGR